MRKRNWKTFRPNSLQHALEGCVNFAREQGNLSIERVADLMGLPSHWSLYKWIENGNLPARLVATFEHATGASFVTQYFAATSRKLLIDIPSGRKRKPGDVARVQETCTAAVQALLHFDNGKLDANECIAQITIAMEHLAAERAQVEKFQQPGLDLT